MAKQHIILLILYAITTLNFISMSIFSPVINRQLRILEISPFALGIIGSVYGTCQLFSATFIEFGIQRYGVQFMFISALVGTGVNNFFQGFTKNPQIFLIARSSAGFLKHCLVLGRLLLATFVKRNEIAWGFGYLAAFANLGVIIGPSLGSYCLQQENGLQWIFTIAIGIYSLIFFLLAQLIWNAKRNSSCGEEFTKSNEYYSNVSADNQNSPQEAHTNSKEDNHTKRRPTGNFLEHFVSIKSEYGLCIIFIAKFCFNFSNHLIRSNFPLILRHKYGASESAIGYLNSMQSATACIIGFIVSPIIFYIYLNNQRYVILHAGIIQMMSFVLQIVSTSFVFNSIAILMMELCNPFLWVSLAAILLENERCTKIIATSTLLSISLIISHCSQMLAPFCAGIVTQTFSYNGPALLASIFSFVGVATVYFWVPSLPNKAKQLNSQDGCLVTVMKSDKMPDSGFGVEKLKVT